MPFPVPFFNAGYQKDTHIFNSNQKAERLRAGTKGPQARENKRADMKIMEKTRLLYLAFPVQAGQRGALVRSAFSLYTVYKNRVSVKGFPSAPQAGEKAREHKNRPAPAKAENRAILVI